MKDLRDSSIIEEKPRLPKVASQPAKYTDKEGKVDIKMLKANFDKQIALIRKK